MNVFIDWALLSIEMTRARGVSPTIADGRSEFHGAAVWYHALHDDVSSRHVTIR